MRTDSPGVKDQIVVIHADSWNKRLPRFARNDSIFVIERRLRRRGNPEIAAFFPQ
jgi:hypothetical protein